MNCDVLRDSQPCVGFLNQDQQDQMKISGYRRSNVRFLLCWICICLTGGLLRLVLHWWRHWYLLATCQPCSLQEAQQVLVEEDYQGKHKVYHVKPVHLITKDQLKKLLQEKIPKETETIDDNKIQLSVHFSSAHFKNCQSLRTFRCKQLVYAWDNGIHNFNKINGLDVNVPCSYFHQQRGLTLQEQLSRSIVFGVNEITVPLRDIKTLLFLEVLNPFYVFQIFSVVLWFTYDYYYYACVILLMSIFGITMSIIQTKKNQDVLHQTVLNTGNAWVVNAKGVSTELPTTTLVPGDIIEIPSSGCTLQCDAVLLSGNCILDESMLTGESVPVTKTPLPMKRDVIFDKKEHARHTLFCGTKVIQTRYIGSKKVLAFVINTGNITAKGGLIRSILYPPPVDYKFEQDSYKFIQCLAVIACLGFIYTLVTKILRGTEAVKIVVESLDLITIVVPPALPAAMTVGRFYAQKRLKINDIFCISPRSINVAGSIDCCCFDKTGTLTEDGMDMWGVVPKSSTNQFQIPLKDISRLPYDHFLFGMVTCHSITVMNGSMIGDPLDLKMFESTGWTLEDVNNIPENEKFGLIYPTILRQPKRSTVETDAEKVSVLAPVLRQSSVDDLLANVGLSYSETNFDHGIVREFPFTSNLQRMSVITRCLSAQGFNVYCKGSPEMLQQLCQPESIPDDYTQQLSTFAKRGFRIIAVGFKALNQKLNYTKVQRLSREEVEHNLEFLGFVILENRLKPDTTAVINSLNLANIRTIMITGDNILTAMSVARDCGIVSSTQAVITVHAVPIAKDKLFEKLDHVDEQLDQYQLQYTLELGSKMTQVNGNGICSGGNGVGTAIAQNMGMELSQSTNSLVNGGSSCATSVQLPNSHSLTSVKTIDTWTHNESENIDVDVELGETPVAVTDNWRRHYTFAMDGKTWQIVQDQFPHQMEIILTRGAIYARMSPEQKQSLIMELQNLDYYVAMCGDGANDCGALKAAHTGISLSETESSIASPFTSRRATIAAVPNVIKEGRAALVTSFGIFKYMAAYSLVQFISVMILYSIDSNLTDKQYLYIDLGLISIFAFFFGKTEAYDGQLVKQVPLSSLISPTPLSSLLLHLAVVIVFQVAGWLQLHQQEWFVPFKQSDEDHLGCFENYTMFAISSFQYIILAFVFSKGAPYRKAIWSNWPLCLTMVINTCIVVYLVIYPSEWIQHFLQLVVPNDMSFRIIMLLYGVAAFIAHCLLEAFVVEDLIFKRIQVKREQNLSTSTRKYMRLQNNINSFNNWPPISEAYELHDSTEPTAEIQPTYVNLSAEQNLDTQPGVFPGFFDNNLPNNQPQNQI
ncbi:probable cation-transporting ATPase W08D2.5 isoform X2 [Drosophila innubila]|uniref:probable cation-transporting ATPase W08D2.5 isoform X2 n=1 Tax=Drosophila innubila TaxID=198719 RepID=UPI00148B9153|nr:probable cation-transporting ATPase W08D2.5 isoform X2 [Drosophila innubila]XP_034475386.1 probable cation-transporting ATPase W08D2.5 isoform X2 [Drosophila innubila]XP_034476070.1 probable cation-transporting ATPase W08D2.5 isoform X2 [Drosophila innubila]XP_034476893.1 probable cation-transporting ATPase W08D2.5 isoform X2 [Drosophila innubila]